MAESAYTRALLFLFLVSHIILVRKAYSYLYSCLKCLLWRCCLFLDVFSSLLHILFSVFLCFNVFVCICWEARNKSHIVTTHCGSTYLTRALSLPVENMTTDQSSPSWALLKCCRLQLPLGVTVCCWPHLLLKISLPGVLWLSSSPVVWACDMHHWVCPVSGLMRYF